MKEYVKRCMRCFPRSFITGRNELIIEVEFNTYFRLEDVGSEFQLKCKVINWCSRSDHKGGTKKSQDFILKGINEFLGTRFTKEDMDNIYTPLGNACNNYLTERFIVSNYDMSLLND